MAVKVPLPSCLECKWRLDLSDCGEGCQEDVCECLKCVVVTSNGDMLHARIRCADHRSHGKFVTWFGGYCGKEGRWFEQKVG